MARRSPHLGHLGFRSSLVWTPHTWTPSPPGVPLGSGPDFLVGAGLRAGGRQGGVFAEGRKSPFDRLGAMRSSVTRQKTPVWR